jgi:hypothetical protein
MLSGWSFRNKKFHVSGFLGQDTSIRKLHVVTQVYVQMINPDGLKVLLDPCLNGTPSLSNVDPPTFAGDAVNSSRFQAKVILDGPKEIGDLHRWEANSSDVMF